MGQGFFIVLRAEKTGIVKIKATLAFQVEVKSESLELNTVRLQHWHCSQLLAIGVMNMPRGKWRWWEDLRCPFAAAEETETLVTGGDELSGRWHRKHVEGREGGMGGEWWQPPLLKLRSPTLDFSRLHHQFLWLRLEMPQCGGWGFTWALPLHLKRLPAASLGIQDPAVATLAPLCSIALRNLVTAVKTS